ncbi:MAG: penicillin-binding transpeptidase domain-containing protein [Planctomycetaceae bacterium]
MRNRLVNLLREPPPQGATGGIEQIDVRPNLRLGVLFGLFTVAAVAVAVRLAHVQTSLGPRVVAEFSRTFEKREPIVSRDGRILSADGQVLAEDVEQHALSIHFRWLEEPPDPAWLRQQALSRLDRASRRNRDLVTKEESAVLARRTALWSRLAQLVNVPESELLHRRRDVQTRVERIYHAALARRAMRAPENTQNSESLANRRQGDSRAATNPEVGWWRLWKTLVAALTTTPYRNDEEPLVIAEQLQYHSLLSDLAIESAIEIEANPQLYPGARISVSTRRVYPQGPAAAHLIGYRTALDDDALQRRRQRFPDADPLDYQPGDRRGMTGLERYYDRELRGLRGERRTIFNRRGEILHSEIVREPRYGRDLVLSVNLPAQRAAEELLDEALTAEHVDPVDGKPLPVPLGGAIVALDVRTGAVLTAASAPRFDLTLLTRPDASRWREMTTDPRKPLFHRAAEMALPPGSTFKAVSAAAMLESGRIDPEQTYFCQGFLDTPDRYRCYTFRKFGAGHGNVDFASAIARSCNVYFFSAARKLGAEPICDWAARFGFGRPTGIDLPRESGGTIPSIAPSEPRASRAAHGGRGSGEALQLAIGQGPLTATPLQIARMTAAIANGGRLVVPRLAESTGFDDSPSSLSEPASSGRGETLAVAGLSANSLNWLRLGLQQVVAHPQGTGYKTVRLNEVSIAGKTGTAEAGGGRPDHAWFAGYVPAERPRVAFVVVLEHAGPGGHAAGPVAREFVQALAALGLLGPYRAPGAHAN